ncbi:hypothetical protein IMAU70042_00066 [Lactiplantibacillus plantarum]|nr:hypothetical protein [Lactiplantibacillus plantarum]
MLKSIFFVSSLSNSQRCNLLLTLLLSQHPDWSRSETMNYVRCHSDKNQLIFELEKSIQFGTECGF